MIMLFVSQRSLSQRQVAAIIMSSCFERRSSCRKRYKRHKPERFSTSSQPDEHTNQQLARHTRSQHKTLVGNSSAPFVGGAAETLEEDSDFEFLNNFKGAAQILECGDEVIKSVGIDLDNVYLWRQFFVSILPTLVVLLRATVEGEVICGDDSWGVFFSFITDSTSTKHRSFTPVSKRSSQGDIRRQQR
ncbi:hypothetical protein IGI04_013612 [Brassica rapa subsp. trilocularis]|uniref:Uncharacterized protein n=1 Tax=Brassica rapa subsp. trilocularis TaxID=1813537 RepID=A0ABQ7N9B9_BRACM|nr:hypothetical protein IGI04_013612 [Brassica rapa subsp. trilocularis]